MTIVLNGDTGITTPTYGGNVTAEYQVPVTALKNRIINGAMMIDQRNAGASVTVTNQSPYTVDRFIAGMSGANGTAQRVSTSVSGFQYQVTLTGTSSTTTAWFGTRLESYNCTDLVGQNVTLSFYAASSNQAGITAGLFYANSTDSFGNGGTVTQISTTSVNVTSTMTKYSVTFTNLPAGAANGLYIQFVGNGSLGTGTMSFTGVQLEKGSTATSFDYRPYGTELALCQRYCFDLTGGSRGGNYLSPLGSMARGNNNGQVELICPVTLRTSAVSVTATANQWSVVYNGSSSAVLTALTLNAGVSSAYKIQLNFTIGSTVLTGGQFVFIEANNSATANIIISAEL